MIKGTQKKIILLRDTKSPYFNEAYFIVKDNIPENSFSSDDMVAEATRIINESVAVGEYKGQRKIRNKGSIWAKLKFFAAGALFGAVVFMIVNYIVN